MRPATQIISIILAAMLIQSCAIAFGASFREELQILPKVPEEPEGVSAAAGFGLLAGLLWALAHLGKPKVSMSLNAVAALFLLIPGAGGYIPGYVWAGASVIFAVDSWSGHVAEKHKERMREARRRARRNTP